jgi:hypothetical protein
MHTFYMSYTHIIRIHKLCNIHMCITLYSSCHNPSFGLATKARACKGASQEGILRVTSHAPGSVGECEGMNPHTPK